MSGVPIVAAVSEVSADALVVIVVTELVIESTRVSWSLVRLTVSVRPLQRRLHVVARRAQAHGRLVEDLAGLAEQPAEPQHEVQERERGDESRDPSERHRHAASLSSGRARLRPVTGVSRGRAGP